MTNNSTPPFYINQRVVCINNRFKNNFYNDVIPEVDKVYTVRAIVLLRDVWFIRLNEIVNPERKFSEGFMECLYSVSKFAPILENFQSISLSKILEEETKLIGVN